jgi:hypothetical protein
VLIHCVHSLCCNCNVHVHSRVCNLASLSNLLTICQVALYHVCKQLAFTSSVYVTPVCSVNIMCYSSDRLSVSLFLFLAHTCYYIEGGKRQSPQCCMAVTVVRICVITNQHILDRTVSTVPMTLSQIVRICVNQHCTVST